MKVWTDGGSRGNPGPSAWAFVTDTGYSEGGFIGAEGTNNEAEYEAMQHALAFLWVKHPKKDHHIYTDSRLLEGQLMCGWKCKSKNLLNVIAECKTLLGLLKNTHIYHVPREQNKEADKLVNEVLDAQKG